MGMFDFLVKWKINSAFKKNKRSHAFKNLESIKNVLILFSYNDWLAIEQIVRDLKANGKNVVMWTIQPPQKTLGNIIFPANVRIINPKEVSMFQVVDPSVLKEFSTLKYDTLFDLTTTESDVFKYLLANNTSECSIGISRSDPPFYDFIVLREDNMDLQETYRQIKIYLSNLR